MRYIIALIVLLSMFSSPAYAASSPAPAAQISEIVTVIGKIIKLLAPATSIIVLIMVLWGGLKFVRGRGEPKNVEEARNILQYAAVGAALVAGSWLILLFISQITGCDVTFVSFSSNCQ